MCRQIKEMETVRQIKRVKTEQVKKKDKGAED